jgi:hypothetical protein
MSRSNTKHRLGNIDFTIMLKRKLLLPLNSPTTVSVVSNTTCMASTSMPCFRCTRISKKFVHDYINTSGLQPTLQNILPTVGIISPSSVVRTEQTNHIPITPLIIHHCHCHHSSSWHIISRKYPGRRPPIHSHRSLPRPSKNDAGRMPK